MDDSARLILSCGCVCAGLLMIAKLCLREADEVHSKVLRAGLIILALFAVVLAIVILVMTYNRERW